jgi:hypothetical protein
MGPGVRLLADLDGPLSLEQTLVVESDGATHLRYRVLK